MTILSRRAAREVMVLSVLKGYQDYRACGGTKLPNSAKGVIFNVNCRAFYIHLLHCAAITGCEIALIHAKNGACESRPLHQFKKCITYINHMYENNRIFAKSEHWDSYSSWIGRQIGLSLYLDREYAIINELVEFAQNYIRTFFGWHAVPVFNCFVPGVHITDFEFTSGPYVRLGCLYDALIHQTDEYIAQFDDIITDGGYYYPIGEMLHICKVAPNCSYSDEIAALSERIKLATAELNALTDGVYKDLIKQFPSISTNPIIPPRAYLNPSRENIALMHEVNEPSLNVQFSSGLGKAFAIIEQKYLKKGIPKVVGLNTFEEIYNNLMKSSDLSKYGGDLGRIYEIQGDIYNMTERYNTLRYIEHRTNIIYSAGISMYTRLKDLNEYIFDLYSFSDRLCKVSEINRPIYSNPATTPIAAKMKELEEEAAELLIEHFGLRANLRYMSVENWHLLEDLYCSDKQTFEQCIYQYLGRFTDKIAKACDFHENARKFIAINAPKNFAIDVANEMLNEPEQEVKRGAYNYGIRRAYNLFALKYNQLLYWIPKDYEPITYDTAIPNYNYDKLVNILHSCYQKIDIDTRSNEGTGRLCMPDVPAEIVNATMPVPVIELTRHAHVFEKLGNWTFSDYVGPQIVHALAIEHVRATEPILNMRWPGRFDFIYDNLRQHVESYWHDDIPKINRILAKYNCTLDKIKQKRAENPELEKVYDFFINRKMGQVKTLEAVSRTFIK